mmetsp:Transcript_10592/g.17740  ORF Transcript_10592/g.17740 Transcript_10592/m.17740 type:complete len:525 (-) Transcript_10592:3-1577(-)
MPSNSGVRMRTTFKPSSATTWWLHFLSGALCLCVGYSWRISPCALSRSPCRALAPGLLLIPQHNIGSRGHPALRRGSLLAVASDPDSRLLRHVQRHFARLAWEHDLQYELGGPDAPAFHSRRFWCEEDQDKCYSAAIARQLDDIEGASAESLDERFPKFRFDHGERIQHHMAQHRADVIIKEYYRTLRYHFWLNNQSIEDQELHKLNISETNISVPNISVEDYARANLVSLRKPWRVAGINWCREQCRLFFILPEPAPRRAEEAPTSSEAEIRTYLGPYSIGQLFSEELQKRQAGQLLSLLDVGSGGSFFKPFQELQVTALDLCPVDPSAFQSDFLKLQVGPQNSAPIIKNFRDMESSGEDARMPHAGELQQLPAATYDVAVMNMVLSSLQDATDRARMIAKTRQLLKDSGLLLITLPTSFFFPNETEGWSRNLVHEWTEAIEAMGFKKWKHEYAQGKRRNYFHALAFAAAGTASQFKDRPLQPLLRHNEMYKAEKWSLRELLPEPGAESMPEDLSRLKERFGI